MSWPEDEPTDPDGRRPAAVVHAAFLLLLCSSFARFLTRHQNGTHTGWVVALFAVFGLLYALGQLPAPAPPPDGRPSIRHLTWPGSGVETRADAGGRGPAWRRSAGGRRDPRLRRPRSPAPAPRAPGTWDLGRGPWAVGCGLWAVGQKRAAPRSKSSRRRLRSTPPP